ncbi:MAG: DinB family protein [Saprospiraceae bacterium]
MKKLLFAFVTLAFLLAFTPAETADNITKKERKAALNYLKSTKKDLLKAVKGLSAAQLNFKASPERWSIAECLEHITLAEMGLWQMYQGSMQQPADAAKRVDIKVSNEQIIKGLTDRSQKATAPEVAVPKGTFQNYAATFAAFTKSRDGLIQYFETTTDDLKNHTLQHPIFGTIDARQFLLSLAAHGKRHTLQIEELKAHPNFPRE